MIFLLSTVSFAALIFIVSFFISLFVIYWPNNSSLEERLNV